jgi:hypothetical protein
VIAITLLGAINTVVAGVLALIKGQGLPDRLYHDQAEYRKLQDWYANPSIRSSSRGSKDKSASSYLLGTDVGFKLNRIEQTEALLAVGVIGRNRKEVGLLVQVAFKKYNAAKECEESNTPENYYVRQPDGDSPERDSRSPSQAGHRRRSSSDDD